MLHVDAGVEVQDIECGLVEKRIPVSRTGEAITFSREGSTTMSSVLLAAAARNSRHGAALSRQAANVPGTF